MLKIAGIWGGCAGVLYIALNWFSLSNRQALNVYPAWGLLSTFLLILILGSFIFVAMRHAKAKFYKEFGINYAQTFYVGVLTSLVTGLIAGTFAFIYIQFIEPEFNKHIVSETTHAMINEKVPVKDIQKNIAEMKEIYTPKVQFMSLLVMTFVIGIISSSILSVFVRNRDTFSSNQPLG
ncbi:MAG: DUF4199 domain-containing protein [Cytophagaceae bacterium]|nr:DUF4199 domain-containing protein [Cytophagaceae bacterium]